MKSILLGALSVSALLAGAAAPAFAQTTTPDIVVLGQRAPLSEELARVPGGVDSVPFEAFENRLAVSFADTLGLSPGVIADPRFAEEVRLSIRGSGLSRGFHMRGIVLRLDGVPVNLADVPAPPSAASATIGSLRLSDAWVAATPGGVSVAAGYLTIANQSLEDDRLIAVTSPRAQSVETHATAAAGSMASMRATVVAIPAQSATILAPGGLHLMFVGVDAPFEPGDWVPVTLTFKRAGAVEVSFPVRGRGAQPGNEDAHASHGH